MSGPPDRESEQTLASYRDVQASLVRALHAVPEGVTRDFLIAVSSRIDSKIADLVAAAPDAGPAAARPQRVNLPSEPMIDRSV